MSLILDALNRAEQERNEKNHIPTLQSMHSPGDKVAPSLLQRLHLERWLIGLVVAYLAFDFFRDRIPGTAAVKSPPAEQAQVSPAPAAGSGAIVAQPKANSSAAAAAVAAAASSVPSASQDAPSERVATSQSQNVGVKAEPIKPLAVPSNAVAKADAAKPPARLDSGQPPPEGRPLERRPPVIQSQTRVDASAAIAKPVTISKPSIGAQSAPNPKVESLYRQPQESSARGGGSASNISNSGSNQGPGAAFSRAQQITDLPLTLRQQIPSLKYGDHSPVGRSADRQVVLNGNIYKQGDTVVPGLRLVEISEPGIVLEFEGERFRLSAYNSWINFQ